MMTLRHVHGAVVVVVVVVVGVARRRQDIVVTSVPRSNWRIFPGPPIQLASWTIHSGAGWFLYSFVLGACGVPGLALFMVSFCLA